MKYREIDVLIKAIKTVDVTLPLHQKALRKQLLELHSARHVAHRQPRTNVKAVVANIRVTVVSRKALSTGVAVALLGLVILGLALWLPSSSSGDHKKLIAEVTLQSAQVSQMQPRITPPGSGCETTACHSQAGSRSDTHGSSSVSASDGSGSSSSLPQTDVPSAQASQQGGDSAAPSAVVTLPIGGTEASPDMQNNDSNNPKKDKSAKQEAKAEKKALKQGTAGVLGEIL